MQKNNCGIAMIEVLISIGIISLVLLSLLAYQISMIKSIADNNLKTIATDQLLNFSEMLRINTTHSRRNAALTSWNNDNANVLPQGEGDYDEVDDHQCEISINWFSHRQETQSMLVYC